MKRIFILAIFLAVIGILCAVFIIRPDSGKKSDEKPWTVGDIVEIESTELETTAKKETDAVSVFTAFVDSTLRESNTLLNEEEPTYTAEQLDNAVYGMYMYDIDTDGTEEMAVVRTGQDGVFLDVYECESGKAVHANSLQLVLDRAENVVFSQDLTALSHMTARMTIYPQGSDRFLCLTVEQQDREGTYNAYTVVCEYAKQKLSTKAHFRLRRTTDAVTLTRLDDNTLLYWSRAAAPVTEPQTEDTADDASTTTAVAAQPVSIAKYSDLDKAFTTEFEKFGLSAPETKIENGTLTHYKVTAVPSEQMIFECSMEDGALHMIHNGFLQSFLIRH